MYLTASRPDIMFAVCICSRFSAKPKESHLIAVKRIFRYLKGKQRLGLWYPHGSNFDFNAYTDSDFGGCCLDRKCMTRGCQFLGNRLVSWQCKKQTTVLISTCEAEYIAAASCCSQILWIQQKLRDYGLNFTGTPLLIDNNATMSITNNPVKHSKTKHIEIRYHFIRDYAEKRLIEVKVHTEDNFVDLFTKAFDRSRLHVEYKHNQVALLDPNMPEAVHFQGIINFLNRSRLHVALSADPYISLVYIQQFWDTVHQDTDVEPHVLRATVNNTEIAISEETIRAALDLGGNADDPISYPSTLIMGCFQRMEYRGKQNDTQTRKGGLVGEWRSIQLKVKVKQQNVALIPVNTPLFGHLINPDYIAPPNDNWFHPDEIAQAQGLNIPVPQIQVPVQPQIPIPEQVPIPQTAVDIPIQEPVYEEVVHDPNPDLGINMDDFVDDAVNSPIPETEGNVVTEADSSSSSSDTISSDDDNTDSDESRDFSPGHYERLAAIPLANAGKRIKSQARRPRRKSVRDPPSGSVLGKRCLIDESYDTDSDFTPDPTRQKLMSASIAAAKSSQGVEDANFVASLIITPPRSKDPSPVQTPVPPVIPTTSSPSIPQSTAGPSKPSDSDRITFLESQVLSLQTQVNTLVSTDSQRQLVIQTQAQQIADMQALVSKLVQRLDTQGEVQGESTSRSLEGNKDKDTSGNNEEEILLLEFFQDSEEEEAEKIACLDDIDDLFNDMEDDMSDNEIEEGEIVEIEIEKDKDSVTYEGCDGLKVPYNFIQDDVIPEFTYEGVTDSMDSVEDVTMPDDTADSKMDTDDESSQSNKGAETETTHTESLKINEEPVMYRDTGMTREQWREVVNSWMKVLPKSPAQPAQKEKYVNKEQCVGRTISWFYDGESKIFAIKRSDGVQYLKPRIKYFNTLPRCEINGLASKPLINRSKNGLADVIANLIKKEGSSGKYERLKPHKGKRVKNTYPKTGKVTWRYKYRPVFAIHKIPLKNIPQDFLGNMKWWYVDVNTGEARIEDKDNKVIVFFYDARNLINFSKKDQRTLRKNEIMYTDEWREQGLQYKKVLEIWSACWQLTTG
ncbi:hypothetical protein L1987_09133 [Smallanthus sonchifolius]|uniref:Uncharacterized protein n=1 Tax=Smallanthus sonchifolius TaxID=185202 RepID=A0ACB9JML6_9ASTR|nr:hypothetical protein L1987_09133 [Smallanthus sonchifolius]